MFATTDDARLVVNGLTGRDIDDQNALRINSRIGNDNPEMVIKGLGGTANKKCIARVHAASYPEETVKRIFGRRFFQHRSLVPTRPHRIKNVRKRNRTR